MQNPRIYYALVMSISMKVKRHLKVPGKWKKTENLVVYCARLELNELCMFQLCPFSQYMETSGDSRLKTCSNMRAERQETFVDFILQFCLLSYEYK